MNVVTLFLKRELVKLCLFSNTDVPIIVIFIELIEVFPNKFISHVLVDYTAVLRVYNENNTLSEYIMMTKHIVYDCLFTPVGSLNLRLTFHLSISSYSILRL